MCSTSCSCDVACAPARARCWNQPGPGASTGTSPTSGGPANLAERLGHRIGHSQPQRNTRFQYRAQYNRESHKALEFSKRCLRRKARGAFRPWRARNCTWESYGPFQEQKGLIPPSAHHIKKITLRIGVRGIDLGWRLQFLFHCLFHFVCIKHNLLALAFINLLLHFPYYSFSGSALLTGKSICCHQTIPLTPPRHTPDMPPQMDMTTHHPVRNSAVIGISLHILSAHVYGSLG